MKKLLLLVFFCHAFFLTAQVTNEGKPVSWNLPVERNKSVNATVILPKIDVLKLSEEDKANDKIRAKPWRFGYKHTVDYGIHNSGEWISLPNGDRIWKILFESEGATSLNFIFDKFYMPPGAKVYLYSDDREDLIGAYTAIQNQESGDLGTWIVKGHKVWIEYFEPKQVKGQGKLHVAYATHGYRTKNFSKSLGESGNCNQDVDCPIGQDFEAHRDILKKGVTLLLLGGQDWCSGTLINNTNQDKTPYILTANHCLFDTNGNQFNLSQASARFNWISPSPLCPSGVETSADGPKNFSISGATVKAHNSNSDMMLIQLNGSIPSSWDVTFAGWDKTDTTPNFVVGIHHPSGDIMKICRDDSGVVKRPNKTEDALTAQTWEITAIGGGWEKGVTEGGSSGSPLFDQNGRIIGQLFGGGAFCFGTTDNGDLDFYGRFAVSWDAATKATRLKDWLDPLNTNPSTLDAIQNVLTIGGQAKNKEITVFPNPTSGLIEVKIGELTSNFTYEIYDILGQKLLANKLQNNNIINLSGLRESVYFIKITEQNTNKSIVKKILLNK